MNRHNLTELIKTVSNLAHIDARNGMRELPDDIKDDAELREIYESEYDIERSAINKLRLQCHVHKL